MTVRLDDGMVVLEGDCRVEEAETLAALLSADVRPVDLSRCRSLHGAVLQALLCFRPPVAARPAEGFLNEMVMPSLAGLTCKGEADGDQL